MRLNYPKGNPLNILAKLLLNSLFGRFAMKIRNTSAVILSLEGYLEFESKHLFEIIGVRDFGNDNFLVVYELDQPYNHFKSQNINIAIGSAITSYGRIFMSQFKNVPGLILMYTDTDSIFILSPLSPDQVSDTGLGMMKFCGAIEEGIFLGAKTYAYRTIEGEEVFKVKGLSRKV